MFPSHPDTYWCCETQEGHILHIFGTCDLIKLFWTAVRTQLRRFTDYPLPEDPAFYLFHHNTLSPSMYKNTLLPHSLNAARRCITDCWKQTQPPSIAHWFLKINEIKWLEELVACDDSSRDKFWSYWHYWVEFTFTQAFVDNLEEIPGWTNCITIGVDSCPLGSNPLTYTITALSSNRMPFLNLPWS